MLTELPGSSSDATARPKRWPRIFTATCSRSRFMPGAGHSPTRWAASSPVTVSVWRSRAWPLETVAGWPLATRGPSRASHWMDRVARCGCMPGRMAFSLIASSHSRCSYLHTPTHVKEQPCRWSWPFFLGCIELPTSTAVARQAGLFEKRRVAIIGSYRVHDRVDGHQHQISAAIA